MEIEFRGTISNETDFRGTCTHCKSVVKAKRHELRRTSDDTYYAPCPVCMKQLYFDLIRE